ncbi:MAG: VTT domain-containing protein [Desulfoferrobacter sp.]
MAIELRTGNSYGTPLRIASIVGAVVSVGLLIWMLVQHWQAFMTWKAEAGFWSFFSVLALVPLFGFPVTPLLVLAGATFELLPALAGCALATAVNLTLGYLLARLLLRNWLLRMADRRQYELPRVGSRSRLTALLLVRITPGPPLALKNYVGALIDAPFAAYLAIYWTTTMLYALGFLVMGDSLSSASKLEGALAIALLGAVLVVVLWIRRRLEKKRMEKESGL